jgi:5-oxoprolinase (ATP-hydrolysing)
MPTDAETILTCIDRGGTFTDVVRIAQRSDGSRRVVEVAKVPSDRAIIGELAVGALTFGTTVATNALLERRGVPTALFVTRGFRDLPLIRDQRRASLFEPDLAHPPLPTAAVIEVDGRLAKDGTELDPLDPPELDPQQLATWHSAAIVLLHGSTHPLHEQRLAAWLRDRAPHLHIVCGHQVVGSRGYLARIETTWVDAAITPVLRDALTRDRIPDGARALQSDGTLVHHRHLSAPNAVLSGPAGGVLGVAAVARRAGFTRAIGLDMGGTSTDVCCLDVDELPLRTGDLEVAGVRLRTRMLEVATIAAGGGSVLRHDGVQLRVGPDSAGAHPGPQCYGRGGPPTLTDAAIVAGLIDPGTFPLPLDPTRIALPGDANACIAIAREAMAQAIRRLAMQHGRNPRDHALVAFGGAGPQHGAAVAELLGVDTVLVPAMAPVLCAWGASMAVETEVRTFDLWLPLEDALPQVLARRQTAAAESGWEAVLRVRELGSDHGIDLVCTPDDAPNSLRARFEEAFAVRFGFRRNPDQRPPLEAESLTLRQKSPIPAPPDPTEPLRTTVSRAADGVIGPARIDRPGTAIDVPAGWRFVDHGDHARLERLLSAGDDPCRSIDAIPEHARTAHGVELWQNRFQALADEAGTVLARLGHSVNIRERLDFSCAIFDTEGRLVANAPHVPVHLGAMGDTVRDLLRHPDSLALGRSFLTNDPRAGGSHLPDLTVITTVAIGPRRFFVASRAHHADIGGLTPGSMPPHSTRLADEGLVFRRVPLVGPNGENLVDSDTFRALLSTSRQPATVRADLEAQLAANHHMAEGLTRLGDPATLAVWMDHLRNAARDATEARIATLPTGHAEDTLDGLPLVLTLRQITEADSGHLRLEVDFGGTGGPHRGNLNAPPGVVRAAVMYALRVLVAHPMPLNEGVLEAVRILAPPNSLVDPPVDAAVVGGNVETSQRIVDLFFRACGHRAESQGTMNNLTLGADTWSTYETIGGGLGATHTCDGISARQVHMTNTRASDPEVLESRLPVRVHRVAIRQRSGGAGLHRGGDGAIREVEVLAPATATLLAAWRTEGARGLDGGGAGAPGCAWIDGVPWTGAATEIPAGTRIKVETPGGGATGTPPAPTE